MNSSAEDKKEVDFMQFKRVLASFLSAAMLCSAMPAALPALAADGESLADQIAAAADGATVALDGNYTEAVTIPEGKSIVLDLKGHTLTSEDTYVIRNSGELTITDSAGGGRIERTACKANHRLSRWRAGKR